MPIEFNQEDFLIEKSSTEKSGYDPLSEDLEEENDIDFFKLHSKYAFTVYNDACNAGNELFIFLINQKYLPVFLEAPYSPPEII